MTLQELHTKFPSVHALFVDSPEFTPPRSGDIGRELFHFLWSRGFRIVIGTSLPPSKRSRKRITYGGNLIIHDRTIELEDRRFLAYDEAWDHVLDHALDILQQELKITV